MKRITGGCSPCATGFPGKPTPSWFSSWTKTASSSPAAEKRTNWTPPVWRRWPRENIAATGGLAKLLGEQEFSILFHEGEKDNLHLSILSDRYILVVVFDTKSSLGLVRLRVKKASQDLETVFEEMKKHRKGGAANPLFTEITDEDIDTLFD